ncbi:DNA repair protein Dds20/Mei5 [Blumeria hordei DH14]|uniref:DNA repair protein Dds20/Mei5 n=1 Tax=Blumeria graminis f. sp. hordei (strain DH14) TaxID=546991 RepID=N1JLP9_BLUG1|nr:DNA repair protein Dds20/Mei5 [Blumeria hordei DH14]
MATPAAKRRRIHAANKTLSKPFRSPFKPQILSPDASSLSSNPVSRYDANDEVSPNNITSAGSNLITKNQSLRSISSSNTKLGRRFKPMISSPLSSTSLLKNDHDIAPLLQNQRKLENQLKDLKKDLEVAEQAKKIEQESYKKNPEGEIDGELNELITRWTLASRQAAEELYCIVKDRVNSMGGPRAWKEMEKRRLENFSTWDEEVQAKDIDSDGEKNSDCEKRDIYAEYSIDPETENEKSQKDKNFNASTEFPGEEDDFTMAMMLRTMNIDLNTIGYDCQQQRWSD